MSPGLVFNASWAFVGWKSSRFSTLCVNQHLIQLGKEIQMWIQCQNQIPALLTRADPSQRWKCRHCSSISVHVWGLEPTSGLKTHIAKGISPAASVWAKKQGVLHQGKQQREAESSISITMILRHTWNRVRFQSRKKK